ncbi:hypothetical protein [Polaromonas sp. YR568]|uniref:hypothetical protein n=1 Tax=Polaromonas sp. YR568 TaxID=1855301 RepID=UPI003137FFB6
MSKKNRKNVPVTKRGLNVAQDFDDAIERLVLGNPLNAELKQRALEGKLKINASTVAQEAGHSRTLIALNACKFPLVREKILDLSKVVDAPSTSMAVMQKLRQENRNLKSDLDKSRSLRLLDFYEKEDALKDARRWKDAYQRLMKTGRDSAKIVSLISKKKVD